MKVMGKGVLIFNRNKAERLFLSSLLRSDGCVVFETPYSLEALKILQKEDVGIILASRDIEGMEADEFKELVAKIKTGVSTIVMAPFSGKDKEFTINTEEFLKLIHGYIKSEDLRKEEFNGLKQFAFSIVDRLLQIFDVNEVCCFNNDHLVGELARKIARNMKLDENLVDAVQMAALLRDLGMIGIHSQILEGNKRLSQSELIPVKEHPIHTVQILRQVKFPWNLDSIISQHHERYDGSGYPLGLKGREISIGARILSVADSYYAMTTERPYKKNISRDAAIQEIVKNAGSQFDPEVVEVFLSIIKEEPAEVTPKKSILIFERESNIAALIKLSINANEVDITHITSSIEAIGSIRQKNPDIVIANVEALDPDAFIRFYNAAQLGSSNGRRRFLFIVPDEDYPKHFKGNVAYIAQPLDMGELKSKIRSLLYEVPKQQPQEEVKGLTGDLRAFSLTDIVQILSLGLKTAKVEVIRGDEKGYLYLHYGNLVHTSLGGLRGPEAFYELVTWDTGKFSIMHGQSTNDVNITMDTMHLLLEATTFIDKKNAGKSSISVS